MKGDLQFGEPFGSLDNDECHPWVDFVMRNMKFQIYTAGMKYFPWVSAVLLYFVPRSFVEGAKKHFDYATVKLYNRIERKTDRKDIMSYMLKENMQREMSRPEIEATGALIIIGAAETTSAALTAATNLLIRNPRAMHKLQDEIRGKFKTQEEITFAAIESLEYMNAVLKETMRFTPPVPMQVPFKAPAEGGYVAGHYIPPYVRAFIDPIASRH
jgi:cytochrome P450